MSILSDSAILEINNLKSRYPQGKQKSALLPALHIAQAEKGWLPVDAMDEVAGILQIKPIEVYEVATFYTMFHVKPVGKYVIEVCRTGPCCTI
ncbi:MAG TPA: NAD(P)H-dependent oxidoreductase subunit E, partial [Saprospiraceae bacterium]|nr:NAD(P)H-dependent oxidoreductase subunit E [Saprospiraceae bacterium]